MIIEAFIDQTFTFVEWLLAFVFSGASALNMSGVSAGMTTIVEMISKVGHYVPLDIFVVAIGNILIWIGIHMAISFVRFLLDFIPFVGGG